MASQPRNIFRLLLPLCVLALVAGLGMPERASAQTLTNADIVRMVQAKLGDDVIISEIKHSTCNFDTSPSALIKLKQAGVSDKVLEAMTGAGHGASGELAVSVPPNEGVTIPLPENYGIYATYGGKLYSLFGGDPSKRPLTESTVLYSFETGSPKVYPAAGLDPRVAFVVFDQESGELVRGLTLYRLPFGRYLRVTNPDAALINSLGPQKVGPQMTPLNRPLAARLKAFQVPLLSKPVRGQSQMVEVAPSSSLDAGNYLLFLAKGNQYQSQLIVVGTPQGNQSGTCVDINFAAAGFGGAIGMNDYWMMHGPPEFPEITPHHYSICNGGPLPSNHSGPSAPQPGAAPASAPCGDYKSCLRAGFSAENARDWQTSIDDFHAAAMKSPSSPEPWTLLGGPYLQTGQIENFKQSWDKALKLGGNVGFDAWHQLAFHVERGGFQLNHSLVSFSDPKGKTVFSAAPSEVKVIGAYKIQGQAYLRLRISGRAYNIIPIPFGPTCQVQITVECPAQAVTQQQILARYIAQTIPKLASGALAQQTPPQASAICPGATYLGYSIEIGQQTYKVEAFGPAGPNRVHVFLDQAGAVVRNSSLLQQLALGAWTREIIVDRYTAGNGSGQVKVALAVDANLEGWEDATDILARATVESIKAVATGGASLNAAAPNLTLGIVEQQLTNPKIALAHWAHAGMEQSLTDYREIESLLPAAREKTVKLSDLRRIESLYSEANTLFSVSQALVSAIAPTTWQDEFANYISSAVSELKPSLPVSQAFLTLNNVLKLEELVAAATKSFSAYKQSLDLALAVAASTQQKISTWASGAATACTKTAARNTVTPNAEVEGDI